MLEIKDSAQHLMYILVFSASRIIILYRKVEKTNISYFIIKNTEITEPFYMELQDAPDDIKNKILDTSISSDISSSTSTTTRFCAAPRSISIPRL